MEKALSIKLEEFPDKDKYLKKVRDMERLTKIYNEYQTRELTKEELRFLYEIDGKILGFGYNEDPRIKEIITGRNIKQDLSKAFNCTEDQISLTKEQALLGNVVYHYGNLDLGSLTSLKNVTFPETIGYDLILRSLTSLEGVILPKIIGRALYLLSLTLEQLLDVELPKFKEIYLANNVKYTYEECMEELAKLKLTNIKNEKEALLTEHKNLMETKSEQIVQESEDSLKK